MSKVEIYPLFPVEGYDSGGNPESFLGAQDALIVLDGLGEFIIEDVAGVPIFIVDNLPFIQIGDPTQNVRVIKYGDLDIIDGLTFTPRINWDLGGGFNELEIRVEGAGPEPGTHIEAAGFPVGTADMYIDTQASGIMNLRTWGGQLIIDTMGGLLDVDTGGAGMTFLSGGPIAMVERALDPAATANQGKTYTKDVGGVTHLFYRASNGTVYQITPGGALNNTLDQAYDQGGPGAGRQIIVDSGPVQLNVPTAGPGGASVFFISGADQQMLHPGVDVIRNVYNAGMIGSFLSGPVRGFYQDLTTDFDDYGVQDIQSIWTRLTLRATGPSVQFVNDIHGIYNEIDIQAPQMLVPMGGDLHGIDTYIHTTVPAMTWSISGDAYGHKIVIDAGTLPDINFDNFVYGEYVSLRGVISGTKTWWGHLIDLDGVNIGGSPQLLYGLEIDADGVIGGATNRYIGTRWRNAVNTVAWDVVEAAAITSRLFSDGDLVLGDNTMVGTERLHILGGGELIEKSAGVVHALFDAVGDIIQVGDPAVPIALIKFGSADFYLEGGGYFNIEDNSGNIVWYTDDSGYIQEGDSGLYISWKQYYMDGEGIEFQTPTVSGTGYGRYLWEPSGVWNWGQGLSINALGNRVYSEGGGTVTSGSPFWPGPPPMGPVQGNYAVYSFGTQITTTGFDSFTGFVFQNDNMYGTPGSPAPATLKLGYTFSGVGGLPGGHSIVSTNAAGFTLRENTGPIVIDGVGNDPNDWHAILLDPHGDRIELATHGGGMVYIDHSGGQPRLYFHNASGLPASITRWLGFNFTAGQFEFSHPVDFGNAPMSITDQILTVYDGALIVMQVDPTPATPTIQFGDPAQNVSVTKYGDMTMYAASGVVHAQFDDASDYIQHGDATRHISTFFKYTDYEETDTITGYFNHKHTGTWQEEMWIYLDSAYSEVHVGSVLNPNDVAEANLNADRGHSSDWGLQLYYNHGGFVGGPQRFQFYVDPSGVSGTPGDNLIYSQGASVMRIEADQHNMEVKTLTSGDIILIPAGEMLMRLAGAPDDIYFTFGAVGHELRKSSASGFLRYMPNATVPQIQIGDPTPAVTTAYMDVMIAAPDTPFYINTLPGAGSGAVNVFGNGGVSIEERTTDPAARGNETRVYSKVVAGASQLFARTEDGTVHQLTPSFQPVYGELYIDEGPCPPGTVSLAIGTCAGGYTIVNNTNLSSPDLIVDRVKDVTGTPTDGRLTIGVTGVYKIEVHMNGEFSVGNQAINGALFVNGVRVPKAGITQFYPAAGCCENAHSHGFLRLEAGDYIDYRFTGSAPGTINFHYFSLTIHRLE